MLTGQLVGWFIYWMVISFVGLVGGWMDDDIYSPSVTCRYNNTTYYAIVDKSSDDCFIV